MFNMAQTIHNYKIGGFGMCKNLQQKIKVLEPMNNTLKICLLFYMFLLLFACKTKPTSNQTVQCYNEAHRPQYHFSPPKNWMNDPNGMVYYEGEYHLFYQYYPDGNTWGPMHWGHAISTDLINWKNYPIALYPDSLGYIFSGSAVIDWKNTSGFGKNGKPAMVAIYTYHSMEGEKSGKITFQTQGIAYSNDKGRTWKKHKGNPVVKNPGIKDFRDPKVFWHEGTKAWIMTLAVKNKISFYTSADLLHWKHSSDFNPAWAAYGGVWECPDLFPIKTPDGEDKFVLLVSINPGGPNGGSATQYFVGDFDGKNFTPLTSEVKWLDYGADNYAGVTWSDVPKTDGRRLFIGWMSNWLYAQTVPTTVWRSAMTIPRSLELHKQKGAYKLFSKPVVELTGLRKRTQQVTANKIDLSSDILEIDLAVSSADFQLVFSNKHNEKILLAKSGDRIVFDRSQSGITNFNDDFRSIHYAPAAAINIQKIKVFIDRSSIEFVFNEGELNMTELVFPKSPYTLLETQGFEEQVIIHQLRSIWNNKKTFKE